MTHPGISSDETDARLHRSGQHDDCGDCKRNAKDETDHSKHNASDDLDNIVRYSFANYSNNVLNTVSGFCCPVVISERITDHPQDCSENGNEIQYLGLFFGTPKTATEEAHPPNDRPRCKHRFKRWSKTGSKMSSELWTKCRYFAIPEGSISVGDSGYVCESAIPFVLTDGDEF